MHRTDPFPIPEIHGLRPTHALDWPGMARKLVRDVLQVQRLERVIVSADPYYGAAMLEAVREEIQRVGAFEYATIMHWTPGLTDLRAANGRKLEPEDAAAEDEAMVKLFEGADVFIWLMNRFYHDRSTIAIGQTEHVLDTWRGRSAHFHWFHDPNIPDPAHPINMAIDKVYERAILELDYAALKQTMQNLKRLVSNRRIRVTNPAGTDISFDVGAHFHTNFGDASKERIAGVSNARDREEELPCGCFRTIPLIDTVEGVMAFESSFGYPAMGHGLDVNLFLEDGLRIYFETGRIVRIETDGDQKLLDRLWSEQTGDKDRLGEMVLGCNPLLTPVEGSGFAPYYGFGEGALRLTIGENIESGGTVISSLHRWLMFFDATIEVDGELICKDGSLTQLVTG